MKAKNVKYPGISTVINGNGAVAHVMGQVCGGVIGYPITPSTEISEIYEAFRAEGGINVWGKHPFFFEPEGEHSAQSGALGAQLTGGQFISNASSSQGILYALESHFVTVGKKVGGFVLQIAARVVSKHSLNVMAGHDDVYALLSSGYTVLFGANPQEAADLAAISYRTSALSLIPVANAMDGFATSHMMSEALLPEPDLLREYLGDPQGRIPCPTLAQEVLYGAKGRVHQLNQYLLRHEADITAENMAALKHFLDGNAAQIEKDNDGTRVAETLAWLPEELHGPWRRQWRNAFEKGTRQLVPALVDVNNPGLTGAVQNQPDFQAGSADHRTHFVSAVPALVRQAMADYSALTGRVYSPVHNYMCDDADYVMVGLGSVCDDVEAVVKHLRGQGKKVGLVSIKLLQPFPEAELVAALAGKKAVTVLERSDQTALTTFVTQALFKARENGEIRDEAQTPRHADIPAIQAIPALTTAIFGLGGHDLQPRHLIAGFKAMETGKNVPLIYLGSQFFSNNPTPRMAELQARMKAAYPETVSMALETEANPRLLPAAAFRVRFHSVGGYGTIASGKLLTDILAGVLDMHSKSAPKYGSEKSGAPTNYYITLSPEPIKITNAELEDVEVVISPDHRSFVHANPLKGLAEEGTFILQSSSTPEQVWAELPPHIRKTIRDKKINFFIIDAFAVAKRNAPPELATRMMGIAFIGAVAGHVKEVAGQASPEAMRDKVRKQITKKFGSKGEAVVESNMQVIREGMTSTQRVDYNQPAFVKIDAKPAPIVLRNVSLSASMCQSGGGSSCGMFDREYFNDMIVTPFKEGTIAEAPVLPGTGLFMPAGSAGAKDKGLFRRAVPLFNPDVCTGCMECSLVCPDAAIPNSVHDIDHLLLTGIAQLEVSEAQREAMRAHLAAMHEGIREAYRNAKEERAFHEVVAEVAAKLPIQEAALLADFSKLVDALAAYPVARTRPFFDAMEKTAPGAGGLFAATVDPWKCTGCLECVEVCGPGALSAQDQDGELLGALQKRFEFMSKTPNTPARFFENALDAGGEAKRLLLDRNNYYATTGGHGGCRGCGEVTAIRQVLATSHAINDKRRHEHIAELETLIDRLEAKRAALGENDAARRQRIDETIEALDKRLYLFESGPTGNGPAGTIIANSTGCSSVYSSTFPFNSYNDPWVNSLFQDAQPLAKGIFEGISAQALTDMRALRTARLELDDGYVAEKHDTEMRLLSWNQFTQDEMSLLPTVMTVGGDGATYDIGFGALSRILATNTPIKVVVLNTGAYSNTGGQASTSSFIGQDSDLARHGNAHSGKYEARKELGLIASFHSKVFVCSTSTALQGHFLKNTMEAIAYTDAPAVLDVYTPCQGENGVADNVSAKQALLAVKSRMNPVFVHDPRRGKTLHDWFSLDGNPEPKQTWSKQTIEYLDDAGELKLMTMPLTPASFALTEIRFKKQFRKLKADAANLVPVEQFIDLPAEQRAGKTPFIYTTDANKKLVKYGVSPSIVALVEERRRNWHLLQYLDGQHVAKMSAEYKAGIAALQAQVKESMQARDASLDSIARAMSELATASKAPAGSGGTVIPITPAAAGAPAAAASAPACVATAVAEALVTIEDSSKCTNCKTCYQDVPEIFEKTVKLIAGASREVAQIIPGVLERTQPTPELKARLKRVSANCDAEIIHV